MGVGGWVVNLLTMFLKGNGDSKNLKKHSSTKLMFSAGGGYSKIMLVKTDVSWCVVGENKSLNKANNYQMEEV